VGYGGVEAAAVVYRQIADKNMAVILVVQDDSFFYDDEGVFIKGIARIF